MKKILSVFIFIGVVMLAACKMEIPKTFAVKLKSQYGFSLGSYSKNLSEYISLDSITEGIASDSDIKINVYDYNPGGISSCQQYLLSMPVSEIPVDMGSYLSEMDFAEKLRKISFEKEFKVPEMSVSDIQDAKINLPDINAKVTDMATFSSMPLMAPGLGVLTEQSLPISISGVDYGLMEFSEGYIDITITPPDDLPAGCSITIQFALGSVKANPITVTKGSSKTAKIPLKGTQLTKSLPMKVSGSAKGGSSNVVYNYSLNFGFSSDIKIKKITSLTMDLGSDGILKLDKTIKFSTDETFVSCVIKNGELFAKAEIPEGWQNVAVSPVINLSGAITAADGDFSEGGVEPGKSYLINKHLDLGGRTYSSGNINVVSNITITLNNSTLVFTDENSIDVNIDCKINSIEQVTVNLEDIKDSLNLNVNEDMPGDIKNYIEYIKLGKSGFTAEYANELPEGNDIKLETYSDFFEIGSVSDKRTVLLKSQKSENVEFLSDSSGKTIYPATEGTIDFNVNIKMPGATVEHPYYATFSNIELGKSYKFSILINPVFNWEKIAINLDAMDKVSDTIDTKFTMGTIFNTLSDVLGDSTAANKMNFVELPVYIYAVSPDLTELKKIKFSGVITGKVDSEKVPLLPNKEEILAGKTESSISVITKDVVLKKENNIVVTDIEKIPGVFKANIVDLLNLHSESSLVLDYKLGISSEDGNNYIEIESSEIENIEINSIRLNAMIVIKLKIDIIDDIELNVLKLGDIDEDKDLFDRTEPTDFEDFEKYMDIVQKLTLVYSVKNTVLDYVDPQKSASVELYSENPALNKQLSFGGGSIDFGLEETKNILRSSKFTPKITIKAPSGVIEMKRDAEIGMNAAAILYADGQVVIF